MPAETPNQGAPPPGAEGARGVREQPAGRAVVSAWRRLTGGRRVRDPERGTLVACSGGADSSALAILLARTPAPVVIAHVLHDLRPEDEARADLEATRELASRLGRGFAEASVRVRELPGNAEANARRLRYGALERLAGEHGLPFVATGHQAQDQAETVLMRLLRGAGPRGLGGIAERRRLGSLTLVRPMLGMLREEAEQTCRAFGWAWREDRTNQDASRLRAGIRHGVLPHLRRARPDAVERLAEAAALQRSVAAALAWQARQVRWRSEGEGWRIGRSSLAAHPDAVAAESLRRVLVSGGADADRVGAGRLGAVVRAAAGVSTAPRTFEFRGARVDVTAHDVLVRPSGGRGGRSGRGPKEVA